MDDGSVQCVSCVIVDRRRGELAFVYQARCDLTRVLQALLFASRNCFYCICAILRQGACSTRCYRSPERVLWSDIEYHLASHQEFAPSSFVKRLSGIRFALFTVISAYANAGLTVVDTSLIQYVSFFHHLLSQFQ